MQGSQPVGALRRPSPKIQIKEDEHETKNLMPLALAGLMMSRLTATAAPQTTEPLGGKRPAEATPVG